jgi:hypothetical protein
MNSQKSSPQPLRCIPWFRRFFRQRFALLLVLSPTVLVIVIDLRIILLVDAFCCQTSSRSWSKDCAVISPGAD